MDDVCSFENNYEQISQLQYDTMFKNTQLSH